MHNEMALCSGISTPECFQGVTGLTIVRSSLRLSHSFIVQQYLRSLLQKGYLVILVAAEQSFERYQYASKKTGLNLLPYCQSGHLVVLDAPLAPLDEQSCPPDEQERACGNSSSSSRITTTTTAAAAETAVSGSAGGAAAVGCSVLQQLYGAIRRAAEQQPPSAAAPPAGVAVILDSLTVLASLRRDESDWAAFLHYCCTRGPGAAAALAAGPHHAQVPYCVIAGAYDDVPDDRAWLASLEHKANVVVEVEPLPGQIADVDGVVTLTRRYSTPEVSCRAVAAGVVPSAPVAAAALGGWQPGAAQFLRKSLYFKSSELAVKWMENVTARELL